MSDAWNIEEEKYISERHCTNCEVDKEQDPRDGENREQNQRFLGEDHRLQVALGEEDLKPGQLRDAGLRKT